MQRPAKSIGSIAVGQEKQKSDLPCSWDIEPFRRGAGSRLMQNQQSLPLVQLLLLLVQLLLVLLLLELEVLVLLLVLLLVLPLARLLLVLVR